MNLQDFERTVARVTGESRREIRRRGFQPVLPDGEFGGSAGEDDGPTSVGLVDWDALEAERPVLFP